jgi:hypothetical protein
MVNNAITSGASRVVSSRNNATYLEFDGAGRLTEAQYQRLGRIGGSIEAAVDRAFKACAGAPRQRDSHREVELDGQLVSLDDRGVAAGRSHRRSVGQGET